MPNCNKCNKYFPSKIKINKKERFLHKRKFCLECSPFGTRKFCGPKPFITHEIQNDRSLVCTTCNNIYVFHTKSHYSNLSRTHETCTKCSKCVLKDQRDKKKEKAIEYKGGQCQICGYTKSTRALVFHHLEPEKKEFNISGNITRTWEVIKNELDKCILLCSNCHMELHAKATI